jgi:hypothetical protein
MNWAQISIELDKGKRFMRELTPSVQNSSSLRQLYFNINSENTISGNIIWNKIEDPITVNVISSSNLIIKAAIKRFRYHKARGIYGT